MKKLSIVLFVSIVSVALFSCIKNSPVTFQEKVAEIDQTTWNANAAGLSYPILTRVPATNRAVGSTTDSTLRRLSGTVRLRINLVGPQSAKDEIVGYKTFTSPITSISFPATMSGQTPATAAGTLAVSDAVAGTHYTALNGKMTIPANSSFGYIDINVLNAGATAGQARFLGIQLDSTGTIMPSVNYSKIGLVIDQR